jgi:protease stability complex PrcB-like protein
VRRPPVCVDAALRLALVALVLVAAGCGGGPSRAVPYTDLTRLAGPLEFTRITISLCKDHRKLLEILERNNPGRQIHLPPIDFGRRVAYLIATGPRSSTGYNLRIVSVRDEGDRILIVVHEDTPSLGEPVAARVTYPFRLITLPRGSKPVKLKWPGRP